MTPGQHLRERIELALKAGGGNPAPHAALAADYAECCRKLNARLEQLREVLDAGDERQALLMAEAYPSVLDEAEGLGFPKSNLWRQFCQQGQLTSPPEIKVSIVQRLNAVYAKGIAPNHAIYKEFRSAVLGKKDEEAMALARAIEKLAPADANARSERERLENKVFAKRVAELKAALSSGDSGPVLSALSEVEALGMPEREAGSPECRQGLEIRRSIEAAAASQKVSSYLVEMDAGESSGQWQDVGVLIARCDGLIHDHRLSLAPAEAGRLERGRAFFNRQQEAALKKQGLLAAVRSLLEQAEIVESNTQAKGTAPLKELRDMLTELSKRWQIVEGFQMQVEDAAVQKVSKLVDLLRTEIARLQKRRLISMACFIAVAAMVTAAAGWYFINRHQAGEIASQILAEVEARNVSGSAKLVETAETGNLSMFSAKLVAAIESAKAFGREAAEAEASATSRLSDFERMSASENFGGMDSGEIHTSFEKIQTSISELPIELQTQFKARQNAIRQKITLHMKSVSTQAAESLAGRMDAFSSDLLPKLSAPQSLMDFRTTLDASETELATWTPLMRTDIPGFEIPGDLLVRAEALKTRVAQSRASLEMADAAIAEMNRAKDLEAYRLALSNLGSLTLPFVKDVRQARLAHPLEANSDKFFSQLIFPWNPPAWFAVKAQEKTLPLHPQELLPAEDKPFDVLLNDIYSKNIYQAKLEGRGSRIVYTRDRPLGRSDLGDGVVFMNGDVYDPEIDGNAIAFQKTSYTADTPRDRERAKNAMDIRLSNFSSIYNAMRLNNLVLRDGQVNSSLFEVLDRANGSEFKCPTYMAFVSRQIEAMMSLRPNDWGLQFCPSATTRFDKLREAIGSESISSGAWMLPEVRKKIDPLVSPIFDHPSQFLKEAEFIQILSRSCVKSEMEFAGYVGPDGKPVLWNPIANSESLWGFAGTPESPTLGRLYARKTQNSESVFEPLGEPIPFSPLFRFAADRKTTFETARRAAGLPFPIPPEISIPTFFEDLNQPTP